MINKTINEQLINDLLTIVHDNNSALYTKLKTYLEQPEKSSIKSLSPDIYKELCDKMKKSLADDDAVCPVCNNPIYSDDHVFDDDYCDSYFVCEYCDILFTAKYILTSVEAEDNEGE